MGAVYEAEPLEAIPAGAPFLLAEDADHDGWTDLLAPGRLVRNEQGPRGRLVAGPELPGSGPYVLADLDNRGTASLVTAESLGAEARTAVEPWLAGPEVYARRVRTLVEQVSQQT